MILHAREFPSGLGIDPDTQFNMRPLVGRDLKALDLPMGTVTARTQVFADMLLGTCSPELQPLLTIYDVWWLAAKQWELVGTPIILDSRCTRPVYTIDVDGEERTTYEPFDQHVLAVNPCGHRSMGRLLPQEIEVLHPQSTVDTRPFPFLDLPRVSRLSAGSMETNSSVLELWFTGTEFDDLEARDVRACCDWIAMMGHGVQNVHATQCSACGHVQPTVWEFSKETFLC